MSELKGKMTTGQTMKGSMEMGVLVRGVDLDNTLTKANFAADAKAVGDALHIVRELLANAIYFKDVSALIAELDNAIGHANATITYAGGVLTIKANANITATQSGAALLIA